MSKMFNYGKTPLVHLIKFRTGKLVEICHQLLLKLSTSQIEHLWASSQSNETFNLRG